MMISQRVRARSREWLLVTLVVAVMVVEVAALSGPNVCMVKQKYNITKRIKYRAPMSVRTYEWCFSMPPRCSRWNTEMRDLTRLETEERTAEVAVCCPGYKMKDVSCVPICPNGKTGPSCSEDCKPHRWGPNCVHECRNCTLGECSATTGECICQAGWQGESCQIFITTTTTSTTPVEDILTTSIATKTTMPTSTEFMLITTPKSIAVETTSRTIRTTVSASTTPLTTPKVETTTQLTTSTRKQDDNSLKTSTKSTIRLTTPDKDVKSSVEIQPDVTNNKAIRLNNDDRIVTRNKTARPVEAPKSTYLPEFNTSKSETTPSLLSPTTKQELDTTIKITATDVPTTKMIETTKPTFMNVTLKYEYTRKPDTTVKTFPTTLKFKPKEIWIRPAQKEPEHITAVMSEKETERSSVDLISVISIAGGVMMAVITVAVIIVMMERCKRPRYDNVRKINDIRMQVMIDNNDEPPPYVRSIFHTPLPDPPSEKCHYQPISTLDRNLKQFMRPVVVQTISPMMLENFRGILECHYDHLPRRSHDFVKTQSRCSVPPSIEQVEQHHVQRASLTDSAIDALKCEAKMDVIDSTTLEPLYAEIPCWRPPSEHAVEIINSLNGEAVTEL